MSMKNLKPALRSGLVAGVLAASMATAFAQVPTIDFGSSRGTGVNAEDVLIENVRVMIPVENPFQPGSWTTTEMNMNVLFRFDYNTLHLVPVGLYDSSNMCADVAVTVYDSLRGQNMPLAGATVTIGGQSVITNSQGVARFTDVAPEGQVSVMVTADEYSSVSQAFQASCSSLNSLTVAMSPSAGEGSLRAGQFRAVLTWGEHPRDLDSHMTGPSQSGDRWHVYYGTPNAGDMCGLDVDDVTSYGPETITCPRTTDGMSQLRPGVYRYSVHHFSGNETIGTSSANVRLELDNGRVYNFAPPPANYTGYGNVWTVFELTVDGNGMMSIGPVNTVHQSAYNPDTWESVYSGTGPSPVPSFGLPEDRNVFLNLGAK